MNALTIILIILMPAWGLVCFGVAMTMANGTWTFGLITRQKYDDAMNNMARTQFHLQEEQEANEALRKELRQYKLFYDPPPQQFDYTINEEPEQKRPASLVH